MCSIGSTKFYLCQIRYIEIWYNKLINLNQKTFEATAVSKLKKIKYNWIKNIQVKPEKAHFSWTWNTQSFIILRQEEVNILLSFPDTLYLEDSNKILNLRYNINFKKYKTNIYYYTFNIPTNIIRMIGQIRTASEKNRNIYHKGTNNKSHPREI